ncbi:type II secretion system protein [Lacticaseibacillus manihotivorans]|uniref:type II secretion system protein n=1 Tax=Lacticaseibacillus manihotivorans TaxID=88233 RepID=UPI0034E2E32E
MRKHGFTIIEILIALSISIATLITTVSFGQRWWQQQQEAQFFLLTFSETGRSCAKWRSWIKWMLK